LSWDVNRMRIGFTTSLPVEVILAAGHTPVDLNNVFISKQPAEYVELAEKEGFPRTICSWIKGIYAVSREKCVDEVIGIIQGDCSNTHSLLSTLESEHIPIQYFSYPYPKNRETLKAEIARLEDIYKVSHNQVTDMKKRLDKIRQKLIYLDELTWKENKVTGKENHTWLVSSTDFNGDPDKFEKDLDLFLEEANERQPFKPSLHLAYFGVPPIISDLYDYLQTLDAEVVYNEVQRQFSMPYLCKDIVDQYLKFTYPYSVKDRMNDITHELGRRHIDAVIGYTQSFCHRQIDHFLMKKYVTIPFMNLEGDQPGVLDARTKLRIESFIEIHK
jgi:benzoyl-CoA reductase/2-hydroxyglutaryl-CoA dehydratase subunit BcrC/BadD/HgdB